MPTVTITRTEEVAVNFLQAECGVRYWEDATVNGIADEDGNLIPLRKGEAWCPTIDLATGVIENWPEGVTASVHYKVCDAGRYALLDADRKEVRAIADYVPRIMSPASNGYGDYVIMSIGEDGKIEGWKIDLAAFE